jgi:predicted dehydrogenase
MDVGIIGTGWVAEKHIDALKKIAGTRITAIAGRNTDRGRELARRAAAGGNEPRVWDDPVAMVRHARLDAVLVLLAPHAHGELELEIAKRVPAALVEKPVSNDLAAAERAADAFDKAGTLVSVGYMNRYRKTTSTVRELFTGDNRPVLIQGWWVNELPGPLWWRNKAQSGGQFVEQCTHLVDLARWIGGEITSVSAFTTRGFVNDVKDYSVDDAVTVNVRFAGGALGNFTTGCFPQGNPSSGRGTDGVGITFSSRSTQCTLTGWAMDLAWKDNKGGGAVVESAEDIFEVQDRAFVEAVRSGDVSGIRSTYRDGVQTLRVTLAAETSALTGNVITV